jgi:hypothetical protein
VTSHACSACPEMAGLDLGDIYHGIIIAAIIGDFTTLVS